MNEIELLKSLLIKEKEKHYLEITLSFTKDQRTEESLNSNISTIDQEISVIQQELVQCEDKSFSANARSFIIAQLTEYINQMKEARTGMRITRNQGLILDNYLFSMIVRDIQYMVEHEPNLRKQSYLKFTYDEDNSVDLADLTQFLSDEISELDNLGEVNFITLKDYVEGFRNKVIQRYIET